MRNGDAITADGHKFEIWRKSAGSYWVVQTDGGSCINVWKFPTYFDARVLIKEITS